MAWQSQKRHPVEAWQTLTQAHQLVQGWARARHLHRSATLGTAVLEQIWQPSLY